MTTISTQNASPEPVAAEVMPSEPVDHQSVSANGITIEATYLREENGKTYVDMCFDLPDASDWLYSSMQPPMVESNGVATPMLGLALLEFRSVPAGGKQRIDQQSADGQISSTEVPAAAGTRGRRCDTIAFDVANLTAPVTLTVPVLLAEPREGEKCSPANLNRVRQQIDAIARRVMITCSPDAGGVSGTYLAESDNATELEKARQALADPGFHDAAFGLAGLWNFVWKAISVQ